MANTRPKRSIAYVASTLPLSILDIKLEEWGISEVVLQGRAHYKSYSYLKRRHQQLVVRVLSGNFFFNFFQLLLMLLNAKLLRRRIFFFHECSSPVFDALLSLIRINGDHYPQVTLHSFELVSAQQVRRTKSQKLFELVGLESRFDYYRGDADNNEGFFYVQAVKSYPSSIIRHDIAESREIINTKYSGRVVKSISKKIIILCARDVVDDEIQRQFYSNIIDFCHSLGFDCYVKDHPAEHARLNLRCRNAIELDPALPLELLELNFAFVIGLASTALLHYNMGAISVIKLIPGIAAAVRDRRIAHLIQMPGPIKIFFPETFAQLENFLLTKSESC